MNKFNLVKKSILSALVILYDIVSLFWCYIISSNFIYNLTEIQKREPSIEIIGGADKPTTLFLTGKFLGAGFSVLFVLLSVATVFILTVSTFKKQADHKLSISLCVFLILTLIVFMMIPAQTYVISLYTLVRKLSFLKYIQIFYIILSLLIIIINILFAIKRRSKRQ